MTATVITGTSGAFYYKPAGTIGTLALTFVAPWVVEDRKSVV